jgi:hypothetical protein
MTEDDDALRIEVEVEGTGVGRVDTEEVGLSDERIKMVRLGDRSCRSTHGDEKVKSLLSCCTLHVANCPATRLVVEGVGWGGAA